MANYELERVLREIGGDLPVKVVDVMLGPLDLGREGLASLAAAAMSKTPEKKKAERRGDAIKDEPGAEERFMRGIRKALGTPPKPHKDEPKKGGKGKGKAKA